MPHTLDSSYILDADVLIDYRDSDLSIVSLFASQVRDCFVGRSTLEEVRRVSEAQARKLNVEILIPDLEMISESERQRKELSAYDLETYFMANKYGLTCVSNDTELRSKCSESQIDVMWGLEPMKLLVGAEVISASHAIRVARKISTVNRRYITPQIVSLFERQILDIVKNL